MQDYFQGGAVTGMEQKKLLIKSKNKPKLLDIQNKKCIFSGKPAVFNISKTDNYFFWNRSQLFDRGLQIELSKIKKVLFCYFLSKKSVLS